MWYIYANAHSIARKQVSYVVGGIVFLCMKIFVCFIQQAHLLAIVSKLGGRGGGGGDNTILPGIFGYKAAMKMSARKVRLRLQCHDLG
jgi:hypothetical protein